MEKRGVGKKAQIMHEFYMIITQLFLIALIAVALTTFVTNRAEGLTFSQDYYSRDLSLLLNTIYAAPGNLNYNYRADLSDFNVSFRNNLVQVWAGMLPISYSYFSDTNFKDLNVMVGNLTELNFIKTENEIKIEKK